MGYTFDKTTNTLKVCEYTGIKICDIANLAKENEGIIFNHSGHKWVEGFLKVSDFSVNKLYEVFFSYNHPDYDIIIRAKKPYYDAKFEEIFNLGFQCSGWSPNTIIGIIKNT